jgi:hypothetical protein
MAATPEVPNVKSKTPVLEYRRTFVLLPTKIRPEESITRSFTVPGELSATLDANAVSFRPGVEATAIGATNV